MNTNTLSDTESNLDRDPSLTKSLSNADVFSSEQLHPNSADITSTKKSRQKSQQRRRKL